ncbi:MAG: WhiB family transcriptional regulator [Pseudonocardiaceae bacterium]|nr:MAG: WhiB family transcriptional regulator [Pseudonocardiaceae bacterium]
MTSVSVVVHAPDRAPRYTTPCQADPDLFFPVSESGPSLTEIAEAKRLCRSCPRTTSCLQEALDRGLDDGIWGGQTTEERRASRRRSKSVRVSR